MEWGGKVGKVCEWSEVARWERWETSEVGTERGGNLGKGEGSEQRRWDGI